MNKKWSFAMVLCAIIATGCNTQSTQFKKMQAAFDVNSLAGEWNVVMMDGKAVTGEDAPFIGFDPAQSRIFGSSGCNLMNGELIHEAATKSIRFERVASTRRACPHMNNEQEFFDAFNKVRSFELTDFSVTKGDTICQVSLMNEKLTPVLIIQKRKAVVAE